MITHWFHTAAAIVVLATTLSAQQGLDDARRLLSQGRVDEALLVADAILQRTPKDRAALLLAAEGNLQLVTSTRSGTQFFLVDAKTNLEHALDIERRDPAAWLKLADVQLKLSEFDDGVRSAKRAIKLLEEQRAPAGRIAEAYMALADNQMQLFVEARRAERSTEDGEITPSTDRKAQAVLLSCNQALEYGAGTRARRLSAQVFQWLDRASQAISVLEAGIKESPAEASLHEELQNLYLALGHRLELVGSYKQMAKVVREPLVGWFLGRAQVAYADGLRTKGNYNEARQGYAEAEESFAIYKGHRPAHAEQTAHWQAICRLSEARCAYELDELAEAEARYIAAYDASPDVASYGNDGYPKIYDSMGGNYLGGLYMVGERIAHAGTIEAMRSALAFYERIIERHPNGFGTAYNNAAFTARDLGTLIAREHAHAPVDGNVDVSSMTEGQRAAWDEARSLWDKSYRYYEQAVTLSPEDERIANDCGLMLVYHLHRDYDRARQLFEKAIEIAQPKLDDLAEDATKKERDDASEAVGDPWYNIGILLMRQGRTQEALPFFDKAVEYYPYQRREAARLAAKIRNGGQDPLQDKKKRFAPIRKKVEAKAAEKDFNGALYLLDKAKEFRDLPEHKYLRGIYNLRFAEQEVANNGSGSLISALFIDAVNELRGAVQADGESVPARLGLTQALAATADHAGAFEEAGSLLDHLRSRGSADPQMIQQAHNLRAIAGTRAFVAAKQAGEPIASSVPSGARTSFKELEKLDALGATERRNWASLEQWAGANDQAFQVMLRGMGDLGDPQQLHEVAAKIGMVDKVVAALAPRKDGLGVWWRGRARYDVGVAQLGDKKVDNAIATFDTARRDFFAAAKLVPGYEASSKTWAAYCIGARGVAQASVKRDAAAAESLLTALAEDATTFEANLAGWTVDYALKVIGDRWYRSGRTESLGKAVEMTRRAAELVPGSGDVQNNLGLFARDYGNRLERAGTDAAKYYELSYKAYTAAQQLNPDDVRLRNDRALILVYHLHREYDVAEELLRVGIERGIAQRKENPDDQSLEEAVGDCYENLALLYIDQSKLAEAEKAARKSLEFHPGQNRGGARRHLQRIARLRKSGGQD